MFMAPPPRAKNHTRVRIRGTYEVDEIGGVSTLAKLISSGWGLAAIEGFVIAYLFKLLLKSWEERNVENKQDKEVFTRVTEALEAIERKTERRR